MGSFTTNLVVLGGFLASDPESKDLPKGDLMTRFRLGINNGDEPMFISITSFGRQAETCAEFLSKGNLVIVEGRLHQSKWETEEGEKRVSFSVTAHRVNFIPKGDQRKEEKG